ncbi:MAG: DUF1343 domain-containing protein [Chitinophagaceae bacterium]|nr:DUF1343 domain-containing protein [Chitinophagaceae bacterium]
MQFGIEILLQQSAPWKEMKIAMVTNNAASTFSGEKSRGALLKNGFQLIKFFSPEHGIAVTGADGAYQRHTTDMLTSLPVISLYGDVLAPDAAALQDVDAVLFDIPDVGCRYYTYLWTMTNVMEACAACHKPLIILDRPNPTGALLHKTEGPMLDETHCTSFIGRWNIPLKHCCTLGELAQYFAATRTTNLQLHIIKAKGYQRHHLAGIDFPFVPTSPAIQNVHAAMLYPGTGLLEGVNICEARGTEFPFSMCGAPWINGEKLASAIQEQSLPGIEAVAVQYTPSSGIYTGIECRGVKWRVTDVASFNAVQTGLALLQTVHHLYPQHLQERLYKTVANPSGEGHLDKLLGVQNALIKIQKDDGFVMDVKAEWKKMIGDYLLY